jgi:hypothetical protein
MKTGPAHVEEEVVLFCAATNLSCSVSCSCPADATGGPPDPVSRGCPDRCSDCLFETALRDAAWAIVKDSAGMTSTGHAGAVRWARALLELDDPGETDAPHRRTGPHVCGWQPVGGVWRCVQDYYVQGNAPGKGCGQTWDQAARR